MGRTKRKAISTQEPLYTTPSTPMPCGAIGRYENYFRHSDVHVERALDYDNVSDRFKELIAHYSWAKLVAKKPKGFNITRIREFCAVISEFDKDTNVKQVSLSGITIPFSPKDINRYLGCQDVKEDDLYSTKWNIKNMLHLKAKAKEFQRHICPNEETDKNSFNCGKSDKDVRDLKHLISHNIIPSWKVNVFYYKEACLALAIWKKEPVDIGRLIHKNLCNFAIKMKSRNIIPYPYLIEALCEDAKVPNLEGDENLEPHQICIGTHTRDKTDISKEVESIFGLDIPINVDIASSLNSNGMSQLENDVEGLKGDVLLLNNNVKKLDKNVTELKTMVMSLNDNVMRMTNNLIVSNANVEHFKATMIEYVREMNENVMQGYNHVSIACADLNKKFGDVYNFQQSRDLIQKWQPPSSTSSQVIPVNTPIFKSSTLDGLSIEVTTVGESSKAKVGKKVSLTKEKNKVGNLRTLAKVAMSFDTNQSNNP